MNVREALIEMRPSLALQRAAMDEIAHMDAQIMRLQRLLDEQGAPQQHQQAQADEG